MHRFDIRFDNPDRMPLAMSTVATNFSVHPMQRGGFRSDVRAARFCDIGLFRISMTESRVITDDPLGYFSINVTLRETFEARVAGSIERFGGNSAFVARPEDEFNLRMPDQGRLLVMNVFRPRLDEYGQKRSGREDAGPSTLPSRLSLASPAGRSFRRFLSFLWSEAQSASPLLESERATVELEDALLESLLIMADPEQSGAAANLPEAPLRRAVDYIMANLDGPLSVGRIAAAAGVHGRSLQRAFRTHFGASVMEYVTNCRLDRAHAALLVSDTAATSVTDVAFANGFSHPGRFAAAYGRRFGELPSETGRRRTTSHRQ